MMKLSELVEQLSERLLTMGDCEVRLQTQEKWPYECEILGVIDTVAMDEGRDEPFYPAPMVFIVEAGQCGYGDPDAWDTLKKEME